MSILGHSHLISQLTDPTADRTKHHPLVNIMTIAICAVICGPETWVDIEMYGKQKQDWLAGFLGLTNGIPSHNTFGRVFARIDPEEFQGRFLARTRAVFEATAGQVIALDGKQLRRSHDSAHGKAAIYMVSAWAAASRLVLGQVKVDATSNEITAIPELLSFLELAGCVVIIDAVGAQSAIAGQIIDQEGDYVLALKSNQGILHEAVVDA